MGVLRGNPLTIPDIVTKNRDKNLSRFFVEKEELEKREIVLSGENAAHAKVLRLAPGDAVTVCDGAGTDALCAVVSCGGGVLELDVRELTPSQAEPKLQCSIYMGFPKADKFEHVIQKATELGVYEIVAFPSARCVSKPDEKSLKKKLERWQKIAASAAEQSGRGRIPEVLVLGSYQEALNRAVQADKAILFYENEQATTLRMALESCTYAPSHIQTLERVVRHIFFRVEIFFMGKRIARIITSYIPLIFECQSTLQGRTCIKY